MKDAPRSPYRPLREGQIRILVLRSASPDSPLEAELEAQPLHTNQHDGEHGDKERNGFFEAISYCWGTEASPRCLQMTDGSSLPLTQSLSSALEAFRYADRPRRLWVDAVCINQDDTPERSSQVQMMGSIYARAFRVLVWLGPCLPDGTEPLAYLALTAPMEAKGDRSRRELLSIIENHLQVTDKCQCCQSSASLMLPIKLEDALAAVAKLLERSWFRRLWVVQEVALAKEILVYCGSHCVPWQTFIEVARVPGQFQSNQSENQDLQHSVLPEESFERYGPTATISINSERAINIYSTERSPSGPQDYPHDRIYGVSRVLGLHAFESLRVDYSISVSELYRRVVELSLTASANRTGGRASLMLALAGTESPGAATLNRPSWVPHLQYLSERSRSKNTYYQWAFAARQFFADAAVFRCKISQEDSQLMLVRGKRLGRIQTVLDHSACPSKQTHRRTPSKCSDQEAVALIRWYVRCCRFIRDNLTTSHLSSADEGKLRSQDARDIFHSSYETIRPSENRLLPTGLLASWLEQASLEPDDLGRLDDLVRSLSPYVTGYPFDRERHLSIMDTDHGKRAAWVPPVAEAEDETWYFAAAPYPFIVRRHDRESFKLIGDSLVLGLAESEMLDVNPRDWTVMLRRAKQADSDLKSWMDSERRAELKNIQSFTKLRKEDQSKKNDVESAISKLKSLYREADEQHQWIGLR